MSRPFCCRCQNRRVGWDGVWCWRCDLDGLLALGVLWAGLVLGLCLILANT